MYANKIVNIAIFIFLKEIVSFFGFSFKYATLIFRYSF